jgi:serralysin
LKNKIMVADTLFLQPQTPISNTNLNFANATGDAKFTNYSQPAIGTLTDAQVETLVKGGVSIAIAQAAAIFSNDPTFSELFTNSSGVGEEGSAKSKTQVIANFSLKADQTFSFDFVADLAITVKEIENSDAEYNKGRTKIAFLILDTTNIEQPKIVDYFGIWGRLISSEQIGKLKYGASKNVAIADNDKTIDIDGNNGTDAVLGTTTGDYEQTFKRDTGLTIIEINKSAVKFFGDSLIDNLGEDVIYGSIWNDRLKGSQQADKIYGSLGSDRLDGNRGDDLLEGGKGNDNLNGGSDSDKLYGGAGEDRLWGGRNDDFLVGGAGDDELTGNSGGDRFGFITADLGVDRITDFEAGIDRIVLSKMTFTTLTSAVDGSLNESELAIVGDDLSAAFSNASIAYSTGTGNLFYNQNGAGDGFGEGDRFATLTNIPTLSALDFAIAA